MIQKFLFVPLLLICLLPFTSGLEVIVSQYDYGASAATVGINAVHPSATTADSAWGQSFRSNFNDANLTVLQLWCYQSSATGTVTAYIIGETGTFGSSSVPTGSVLATSDAVQITAGTLTVYNFTFTSGYVLDSAVDYCWYVAGTSGDVANEYIAVDNAAPLAFDPSIGNSFWYDNGAWSAQPSYDLSYVLYGSDGTAVSFNLGGDVTINEITEVTNVTSSPTVNVTTGDVNVGGVTAEFNNTVVNATGSTISAGDVSAGAVTAGDVTANGAVTFGGDLSVNGTFDNATLTYVTSTAVSGDANVYFLIAFIALAVLLTFYNKVPLMNFLVGIVGISFITLSFQNTDLPFWPYSSVLLALVSLLCMISGGFKMRDN